MKKNSKESSFWLSYSDLMTSLFFVILVLFVVTISLLQIRVGQYKSLYEITEAQLTKIREMEKATKNIDALYFEYDSIHKKHKLNIEVKFYIGSANMGNIDNDTKLKLKHAGEAISSFIKRYADDGIQYMVIIEGQASLDSYKRNYELSYERALSLKRYWEGEGVLFDKSCEVLISGSGDGVLSGTGLMRESVESMNQRFLIHIVPKYGEIISQ